MWKSDYDKQECILESSLYLTDSVFYYAQVEKFYIARASDAVTSLQEKIIDDYKVILEYLVELTKVELWDKWDMTSLSCATYSGHEGVAKVLLRSGAQIDAEQLESGCASGMTALAYAAYSGRRKVAKLQLLEKGAKLDQRG